MIGSPDLKKKMFDHGAPNNYVFKFPIMNRVLLDTTSHKIDGYKSSQH